MNQVGHGKHVPRLRRSCSNCSDIPPDRRDCSPSDLIPDDWWKSVAGYSEAFQNAKSMVDSYPGSAWEVSAYMGWLHTLGSFFLSPESKQFFVRTGAWGYKSLNSALASWTELKHDTILYAEQSYAEMGEGSEPGPWPPASYAPPSIKGYAITASAARGRGVA